MKFHASLPRGSVTQTRKKKTVRGKVNLTDEEDTDKEGILVGTLRY